MKIDREELDRLLIQTWPDAYRIAFGILHDRGLAEDAAQEACALVARKIAALKDASAFRAWLYRIVVNCAISLGRRRHPTDALDAAGERGITTDPAERLDLYNALAALPLRQRAAVLLHYYAGLNSAEIADACGFPPGSVRFQLMLARRALRKALATEIRAESYAKEATHDH
ncbi:MAG TPA: RNA polymerase sigma factor [Verrucomicrobiae bacterium]|nr:RNA polymerase sigma factor [Verrucomicrobiae bacterium]HTZ54670.1 RNA polymerase sigma factor [Candidatus Acidoferrum sp.]